MKASFLRQERQGSSWFALIGLGLVHVLLVVWMHSRVLDSLFNDASHRLGPGTDFAAYLVAGKAWLADHGVYGHGPGFGFRYHPLFAIGIGVTLASLPFRLAMVTWTVFNEAMLLCTLLLLRRRIEDPKRAIGVTLLVLFFSPYLLEIYMGNASFVASALILFAFDGLDRGRRWRPTALMLVSLLIKPVGLVFVPLMLVRQMWRETGALLAAFVLSALPYFLAHPSDLASVLSINVNAIPAPGWVVHCGNQGLHGLITDVSARLAGIHPARLASFEQLPTAVRLLLTLLPLALAALALRATLRPGVRSRTGLALLLWSCVYLLGYKDVWEHSYSFVLPILGYVWARDFDILPRRLLLVASIGLALPTAFAFYDVPLPPGPNDPERHLAFATSVLHHATKPLWLILTFIAALRAARLAIQDRHAGDGANTSETAGSIFGISPA
jgi:hypothetical protein